MRYHKEKEDFLCGYKALLFNTQIRRLSLRCGENVLGGTAKWQANHLTIYWVAAAGIKKIVCSSRPQSVYWSWDLIYILGFQMKGEINGLNQEL